jgi:hypothetical protein
VGPPYQQEEEKEEGKPPQPNTAHGATGPEDESAHDEAEAQASLLNPSRPA